MIRSDTRSAFQYALVIFTLTALLGLANATGVFGTLDRNTLLTHLHSGTLGWITMGVIGLVLWMFGGRDLNTVVRISALATAAYVLAFWSGNFQARAIFGVAMLGVVYGWWWFVVSKGMLEGWGSFDTAKLSVLFGLTTLVIGSTLGVIVQVILGTGNTLPTSTDLVGAHASAQVGGYLILVAAGFIEWQLGGPGKRTIAGVVQVALLFIGGLILSGSFLLSSQLSPDMQQALPGVGTLFTLAGAVVVVIRLGRAALAVPWMSGGARHVALSSGYLIVGVVLFALLVQQFIAAQGDQSKVSIGLLHSVDHVYFVGLMTNLLFGAIVVASADRPRVWPWADNVIFWGLNLGIVAFVAVLLTQGSGEGAKPFASAVAYTAPIMGLSALLGIVTFQMRLMPASQTVRSPATA